MVVHQDQHSLSWLCLCGWRPSYLHFTRLSAFDAASEHHVLLEGERLISQHTQEVLSPSSRADSTQPLSFVGGMRPVELACTCSKLDRVQTASQPCLWLEDLLPAWVFTQFTCAQSV